MSALDTQVGGDHYKKLKIQPVEYMHANGIPFIEGCIIKYASRWRDKGGIADLEKIKHFAQLLIDLELNGQEPEVAEQPSHIISDIPDMQEWQNWKGGDVVESMEATQGIENGGFYILITDPDENGDIRFIDSEGDNRARDADKYRFAHRPTSTAK